MVEHTVYMYTVGVQNVGTVARSIETYARRGYLGDNLGSHLGKEPEPCATVGSVRHLVPVCPYSIVRC